MISANGIIIQKEKVPEDPPASGTIGIIQENRNCYDVLHLNDSMISEQKR